MKKLASAASKAKALATAVKTKPAASNDGLIHTGKLKVPFRPASSSSSSSKSAVVKAKKGLLKQLKRRWVERVSLAWCKSMLLNKCT